MVYIKRVDSEEQTTNKWPVGQGVKTSPSHGENTGSIPVLAANKQWETNDQNFDSGHFFCQKQWRGSERKCMLEINLKFVYNTEQTFMTEAIVCRRYT